MANNDLISLAKRVGDDWKSGPYYDDAEKAIEQQWRAIIWPLIKDCDFSTVVEVAAGHGRNTELLLNYTERLFVVDINVENIEFMKQRFGEDERITYIVNNGIDLEGIPDGEATFVYSFDSMVHFDSDVVRAYLKEFQRILAPAGSGFCHYSNNWRNPTGSYRDDGGWRNFMSKELFEHYAHKEGLEPIKSELIDWLRDETYTDAVTLFRKPEPIPPSEEGSETTGETDAGNAEQSSPEPDQGSLRLNTSTEASSVAATEANSPLV